MKPGIKTTELWLTVIASVLIDAGAIPVPDKYKAIATAVAVFGYSLARGLAKFGTGTAPVTGVTKVTP